RAFRDNGAQIYSRTDWNPDSTAMVVYGKAKRDHNHAHNDVGQVCIDAMGQRMIVDLGSPSAYPADFFDENRWNYYNASVVGHNVPMFGNREQRITPLDSTPQDNFDFDRMSGRTLQSHFDDKMGGYWQMDLSRAYDGVRRVMRTVVHLFPGFVAVLDEGELEIEEDISLRWHTIEEATLGSNGAFQVANQGVVLVGRVEVLNGKLIDHRLRRHKYEPPFNRGRMGDLLEQRREPYVETRLRDKNYRVLTLFALIPDVTVPSEWVRAGQSWSIQMSEGACKVLLEDEVLSVSSDSIRSGLRVTL
ncbi:MAG: heparinase II/III family protein, partial [Bacteroidetes bacterium]|nr:heparinase II/III family protein [Bacteroidota bacterium]